LTVDKIIIFDLEGAIAHFRKFYTNSSSLSYAFPPRTVIIGLIAGILGFERDSYYDKFNTENCKIALSVRTPIRKLMQTVNYIRTKDTRELTGSGGYTQVPVEFVLPLNADFLRYRIYFLHKDEKIMENLRERLKNGTFEYPPYLGITECLATIRLIDDEAEMFFYDDLDKKLELPTVVPIHKIRSINFVEGFKYIKEDRVPVEFDMNRMIKKVYGYIYEHNCKSIKNVMIKGEVFKVNYKEGSKTIEEFGVFME